MINVGENIRRLRKERGMTQKELAAKVGVRREAINRYEKMRRVGHFSVICDLAEALEASLDEIVYGKEEA